MDQLGLERADDRSAVPWKEVQAGLQAELQQAVGRTRWRAWFRDVDVRRLDGDRLVLAVPTEVHRTWIGFTYRAEVERACARVLGEGVEVQLEVDERQEQKRALRERLPLRPDEWERLLEERRTPPTFATFQARREDRWAVALLQSLVHGAGVSGAGSLYLYGPAGCGKTHLLRALDEAVRAQAPGECLYLSAKRFTSQYVTALRQGGGSATRAFDVDLLGRRLVLLDGVDGLEGRSATQSGLVRILQRAALGGPRFVLAGREHPRTLTGLAPTLASRLEGGLVIRLALPDREQLGGILVARALARGVAPSPEVVEAILERTGSPRAAVAWIDRWSLASERLGRPLELAWLDEISPSPSTSTTDEVVRRVKAVVARHFAIDAEVLERPTKARAAALPRRVALYLVYRAAAVPLLTLARSFGFKSHSSVSRALGEIRAARESDAELEQLVDGLLAQL